MTNDSFEALFEQSPQTTEQLEPGQKIKATVTSVTSDHVFLDIGGKGEGTLDIRELQDEEGNVSVQPGDTVEAYFLAARSHEMLFTTRFGAGSLSGAHLREAFAGNIPVEGLVKAKVKGGFEVTVADTRCFCPFSQMELRRLEDEDSYVGGRYSFKITEYEEKGRSSNIIVSRRALLEEEREEQKQALVETLREGMTVNGTITSIRDFGAFADIGGVDGLIPVSEIGWDRVDRIHDVLEVGQQVEVIVLKIDWRKDRISLSLKAALPNPWDTVYERFPIGSSHVGTVARLMQFGAFVTLAPGIDGLVHISKLGRGKRINHPREVVQEGQALEVYIDNIDTEKKRISLELVAAKEEAEEEKSRENEVRQMIKKQADTSGKSMGTIGDLLQTTRKDRKK